MRPVECALLSALTLGCASPNPTPPAWRRNLDVAQRSPLGAWTAVSLRDGRTVSGELLAAWDRGLLLGAGLAATHVPRQCIALARVGAFDADNSPVLTLGGLATLSTLTHGFFLIFTAPAWIAVTALSAYAISGKGQREYGRGGGDLGDLSMWARFPQGLPPAFRDRLALSWVDVTCER